MDEGANQLAQLVVGGAVTLFVLFEDGEQLVERVLVAGEEDLFLVLEVVVEIPLLHVQRGGDLLDRGAVIAEAPERSRGALQDVDPGRCLGIGVARTLPPPGTAGLDEATERSG